MKSKYFVSLSMFTVLVISACGGGGSGSGSGYTAPSTFDLTCDLGITYTPKAAPVLASTAAATTTVIALHGKNGSPTNINIMGALATNFNNEGYDVSMPWMPWSSFVWDGDLCEGISYLNELINTEKLAGKQVILLGHSLAAPIVLAYSALTDTVKPDAMVVMAPGHFVHASSVLASLHEASIQAAHNYVTAGQGDDATNTFQTSNGGTMQNITTSATIYLSYHDPLEFPAIKLSIPQVSIPTLWLAPVDDPITTSVKSLGIYATIPVGSNYSYMEVAGDHYTVVDVAASETAGWFSGL